MKFFSLVLLTLTISQMSYADREDCSFACKALPDPNEVITDYGKSSVDAFDPSSIRIHVWNLYKGRKPEFAKEYASLYDLSDIIMLQESHFEGGDIEQLMNPANFATVSANSFFTKEGITGPAITSRVADLNTLWSRSRVKEPFVKSYKLTVVNEFPIAGQQETLLVASIHGLLRHDAVDLANQVNDVLAATKDHKGPFIFAGDFNSRTKERQAAVDAAMKAYGLEKVVWTNENRVDKHRIDHAYIRKLKANKALIKTAYVGSDHPLLYLELAVTQ